MKIINPTPDEKLEFKNDMYVLTLAEFHENFDNVFKDEDTTKKRLLANSRLIYNYIRENCYSKNRKLVKFLLNNTKEGRKFIYDVLIEQMSADVDSGYNDLSKQPAVNLANGQILPRDELKRNQIAITTEQIIDSSNDYFGFNIMYQGVFPRNVYAYFYALTGEWF
jgi:hypothetical protein